MEDDQAESKVKAPREQQEDSQAEVLPEFPPLFRGRDVTIRDDQYPFPWLLEVIKRCRKKRIRFRLVDSGQMDRFQLEWLLEAGADFYSSDETRPRLAELEGLRLAGRKGRSVLAFYIHGPLREQLEEGKEELSLSDLTSLGRDGAYLYLSNRDRARDPVKLRMLAESCSDGGSRLIYYYHGAPDSDLTEIASGGAWIHVSDRELESGEKERLLELQTTARKYGGGLIVYLQKGLELSLVRELLKKRTHLFFEQPQDFKSPYKSLERTAARRKLNFRYYYLYPRFLL